MASTTERIPVTDIETITFDQGQMVILKQITAQEIDTKTKIKTWFQKEMKHDLIDASGPWHNFDAAKRASESGMSVNYEGAEIDWIEKSDRLKDGFALAISTNLAKSEIFPAIREGLKDTALSQEGTPWLPMYIDHLERIYDEVLEELESSQP